MRRLRVQACLLLSVVILSNVAKASDADGYYTIYGRGNNSCGTYLDARKHGDDSVFAAYTAGFLTSTDINTNSTYDILGGSGLSGALHWLDKYCTENPLETFATALNALQDYSYPRRNQSAQAR